MARSLVLDAHDIDLLVAALMDAATRGRGVVTPDMRPRDRRVLRVRQQTVLAKRLAGLTAPVTMSEGLS